MISDSLRADRAKIGRRMDRSELINWLAQIYH